MNINYVYLFLVALLSGTRNAKNSLLSQQIHDRMKKIFQSNDSLISASILLSNTYASSGDIEKASDIKTELYQSGAKRKSALTWTVVNGQVYVS